MGVGHLDIGTGIGDASVFNPNPAIQLYGQQLAQRKAKQDADNAMLASTLTKGYDPNGLRNDADRQSYLNQYNAIKTAGINSANEKDPMKKALALAEVRQQLANLGQFADKSKKQGIQEQAWANHYMAQPHEWDDNALNAYRKSKDAAIGTPEVVNDFTTLQRRVDPDKIDKAYQDHRALLTKNLQYDNGTQAPAIVAGKKGVYVTQSRGLPMDGDNGAFESTLHWATANPDVIKNMSERYPTITAPTPQETLALRVRQYMHDRGDANGIYDRKAPVFNAEYAPQAEQRYTLAQQWNLKHYGTPNSPNTLTANALTPAQVLIAGNPSNGTQGMLQGNTDAMKRLISLTPKGQYGVTKIPEPVMDPATGEHIITFPPQVEKDNAAVKANKILRDRYAKAPEKEGGFLGMGGTPIPIEKSKFATKLQSEYKEKKPAATYRLNPSDPTNYVGQAEAMAADQNIKLPALNTALGQKGGRGQIALPTSYGNITQARDSKGNTITLGYKNGKWYDTKTNKVVE